MPRTTAPPAATTTHASSSHAHHATRPPAVPPAPVVTPRHGQAMHIGSRLQNETGRNYLWGRWPRSGPMLAAFDRAREREGLSHSESAMLPVLA
jgi:hypothetical protein